MIAARFQQEASDSQVQNLSYFAGRFSDRSERQSLPTLDLFHSPFVFAKLKAFPWNHIDLVTQAPMGTVTQRLSDRVVLVVDDEDAVRRISSRTLRDAGFRVIDASDAKSALAWLASLGMTVIGLVVSDIAMPGMTGVELAAVIEERWPGLRVLLISGRDVPTPAILAYFSVSRSRRTPLLRPSTTCCSPHPRLKGAPNRLIVLYPGCLDNSTHLSGRASDKLPGRLG
jgi:CheY-like chemotaxis protein